MDGINKPIANTPLFLQKLEGDLIVEPKFGFDLGVGATFGPKIEGKQLFSSRARSARDPPSRRPTARTGPTRSRSTRG